jgi:hypothetical protein
MKRNLIVQTLLLSSMLLILPTLLAAENTPPFSAKIQVSVRGSENIKGQAESYINRELRSLNDVVLVDEGAEWVLDIVVLELKTQRDYISGIALSAVILNNVGDTFLSILIQNQELASTFGNLFFFYPDHWLRADQPEKLRELCAALVAAFDNNKLEENRKKWRKIIQDSEKKKP